MRKIVIKDLKIIKMLIICQGAVIRQGAGSASKNDITFLLEIFILRLFFMVS